MNELLIRQAERAAKRRKALTALAWTAAILALLLVIGAIVCLVMLGLGNQNFYLLGFLALGGCWARQRSAASGLPSSALP